MNTHSCLSCDEEVYCPNNKASIIVKLFCDKCLIAYRCVKNIEKNNGIDYDSLSAKEKTRNLMMLAIGKIDPTGEFTKKLAKKMKRNGLEVIDGGKDDN